MSEIRRRALRQRAEIGLEDDQPHSAEAVVQACLSATGLERCFLRPDDDLLAGAQAVLNREMNAIFQDESRSHAQQQYDAVHEFAHLWLHGGICRCAHGDLTPGETGEPVGGAWSKVDGYSPRQRRENEANSFAAELLLPGPLARHLFLVERLSSEAIAEQLGLPASLVLRQLADSVLLPPLSQSTPASETPASQAVELDQYQKAAAHVEVGPLLLGAGPGTGKTKTLVGRCQFLTQTLGVPAEQILALTFSRQATQEMRERLVQSGVGTHDVGPWVGTFHSFGLDILRRFGDRLGLPQDVKLLDTLDAVTLLENHLPRLGLDVLDNLYNPAIHLSGIVRQISRAKDELCSPERYDELCREMSAQAEQSAREFAARPGNQPVREKDAVAKALEQAAKAGEVSRCYAVYEALMQEHGFLDFADLISRAVALLEAHPDVLKTLQSEYPHVLADEYQDVNRACAHLVRLVAGENAPGLWAVGDHRQSIYRFRGASPANVAAFQQDYPNGQRMELGINYRSRQPIVDLFGVAASRMETAGNPEEEPTPRQVATLPKREGEEVREEDAVLTSSSSRFGRSTRSEERTKGEVGSYSGEVGSSEIASLWHAQRGTAANSSFPAVTLAVAPDEEGQADGIVRAIRDLQAAGHSLRQQAILCRTHGQAESLAALLSVRDIPVLYLGALLERPEVKDLLCLLSLFADKDGSGLLRVAAFPEYAVPQAETLALLQRVSFDQTPMAEALQDVNLPDGLRRLGGHLAELETMENDPAGLLRHYLFGQSRYLRHLTANETQSFLRMQRLMAIHQLLGLAATFDQRIVTPHGQAGPTGKVREFLTHLRRLLAAGESLRGAVPPEAEELDAVRILTAHAAKGLEYPVVFLPNLGAGQFPARGRHDGIPEPPGLAPSAGQAADEEDCLFFVALSRARDVLVVSRSETSGSDRAIKPSPLLSFIQPWFEAKGVEESVWPSGRAASESEEALMPAPEDLPTYSASALETYQRCPRQYYYQYEMNLTGTFTLGGYPQFHACVRQSLRWLEDERAAGREPTEAESAAQMEAVWAANGPVGHLHEDKYKISALQMLRTAAEVRTEAEEQMDTKTLHATLNGCCVRVRPDVVRLNKADGTLIVARQMTGKPGDDDKIDKRLALLRRAASETHSDRPLRLEIRYLSEGTAIRVEPPATDYKARLEADRVAKYEDAARGITLRQFPAKRSDECRSCAYGLICPL